MRPTPWLLPTVLACLVLVAPRLSGGIPDESETAPPPWNDAPLRVDTGDGTLVLDPLDGPREAGLPLRFRMRVDGDPDAVVIPPAAGEVLGDFEVVPCVATPSTPTDASACWAIRTFGSGDVALPAFDVRVDGRTIVVPARTLRIGSVIGAEAGLDAYRDIADAVAIERPIPFATWSIVAIVVVACLGALFALLRRGRGPRPAPPPIPADVWALEALERLAVRDLPRRGEVQRFFIELTDVVRSFVERRYDISAPERTTREFIQEAERHPLLAADQAAMLGNLLRSADLVKFAGDRPAGAECDRAFELVKAFVVSAGPKPTTTDGTDDAGEGSAPTDDAVGRDDRAERRREVRSAVAGLDELEVDPG